MIDVKKSCGCESVDVTPGTTVPSNGVLDVTYALAKYGAGERHGRLLITTNSQEESLRVIELSLRGEIQPKVWATPSDLYLAADDVSTSEQLLRVESVVPGLLDTFKDVSTNRGNVVAQLEEQSSAFLTFRVNIAPDAPFGTSYDLIYVAFNNPERPLVSVRVRARKGQALSILPATMSLPPFVGYEPHVRKVRVMSPMASAEPFRITKVDCPPDIVVDDLPTDARKACEVKLTFTKPRVAAREQKLLFHTDPPGCVVLSVRYSTNQDLIGHREDDR